MMIIALTTAPLLAHAAVVGDWRFEPGAFTADSAGGATLTAHGNVAQVTYPSAGRGADFPASHLAGADIATNGQYFGATITPVQDFTIEAFFNLDSIAQHGAGFHWGALIAGAFSGSNINSGAWDFEVRLDGFSGSARGELVVGLMGAPMLKSGIVILPNKDYYAAAAVDLDQHGSATFYVQNLTDGGPLQKVTVANGTSSRPVYSTLWIGETPDGFNFLFDGVIDQVRLSGTVLPQSQLLISSVPVPAGHALMVSALVALGAFRSRRT